MRAASRNSRGGSPALLAAVLLLASCAGPRADRAPASTARGASLVRVLVLSTRATTQALSDDAAARITEELSGRAGRRLRVIPRSDALNFLSGGEFPPYDDSYVRQMGLQLRADVILEVEATRLGDSVRVAVSMLRTLDQAPPRPFGDGVGPDVSAASQRLVRTFAIDSLVRLGRLPPSLR
jgi:hypothetical protein